MNYPYSLIENAVGISSENLIGFKNQTELEKTLLHVQNLILSSKTLLLNGFYSQSLFISITSLEEIAKIEVCIFRGFKNTALSKRSKDPLFNHKEKHKIATNPIILIGNRLKKSIDEKRLNKIFSDLQEGKFIEIRENCLYFQRNSNSLFVPQEKKIKDLSFELFLIIIEMMDDKFGGVTNKASQIVDEINELYQEVEIKYKNNLQHDV